MENETSIVTVLIVEDEVLVAQDIANRLEEFNYQVAGIAKSADTALQLLAENPTICILLLDIMLKGDRDGIELALEIKEKYDLPFIFLTSHADRSIVERAKKARPYGYILKPFNDRQISIAIEMALINFANRSPVNEMISEDTFVSEENRVLQIKDSLFLKKNHHFRKVPLEDIHFLKAENNYTSIHTQSDKFLYSMVLKKIEENLPSSLFLRVHRSFVVNITAVTGFEGNLLYVGGEKIPVSKSHREHVFKLFRTIS